MAGTSKTDTYSKIIKRASLLIVPACGVVFFRLSAWFFTAGHTGINNDGISFTSRMLQCVVIILLLIIDRNVTYDRTLFLKVAGFAAFLKTFGVIIFLAAPNEVFLYIGCAINGICSGILMLGWGYYLCSAGPWRSTYGLTLAFALYGLSTLALPSLSLQAHIVLMALCPIVSFFCLRHCVAEAIQNTGANYRLPKRNEASIPWDIVLILSVCTIISILAKLLVPLDPTFSPMYSAMRAMVLGAIFLFYTIWMIVLRRQDFNILWPLFVLIIFSGLLCYSAFASSQPGFASGFFRATQECFMLFCWIVAASWIHQLKLPRVFFFGLAVLIFITPPTLTTLGLSLLFPITQVDSELLALIITVVIAFILVTMTIILILVRSIRSRQKDYSEQAQSLVSKAIESIIIEYKLTKREGEVLHLLITGQSFSQIASTLFLSINTIRTHIKSIYRKIGINEKQQLIALVEENVRSLLLVS